MASQDLIILKDLAFYGYHGVLTEESKLGQRFWIDLTCGLDLTEAANSDRISTSVSYADIYDVVRNAFEERRFHLIEALGQNIVNRLFQRFDRLEWIRIRVRKPEAPIAMVTGEAAIELYRERSA
ncbi:MAG TPA: dihydroneopterin aldolase [Devosiaceae bacterium]|jgi:dihydroneopterin aldolase